jgi:protein phosphatase
MSQARPPLIGAATDPGLERTENQDHMDRVSLPYGELLLVADGMGGHAGGATASRLALQEVRRYAESCAVEPNNADSLREMLYYATTRANEAVYQYWQTRPELKGMGTTLVAALVVDDLAWVAHVGDSRIYLIEGSAGRVTRDHTAVQDRMDHGILTADEAKSHPDRHILSRAIGHKPEVEPEVRMGPIDLKPGASLLLCSDGLCDVVTDEEIGDVVLTRPPQEACQALIRLANQRGGPDNITVMICRQPGGKLRSRSTQMVRRTFRKKVLGLSLLVWLAVAAALAAVALGAFLLWPRGEGEGTGDKERGPATVKQAPAGKTAKEKPPEPGAVQPDQPTDESAEEPDQPAAAGAGEPEPTQPEQVPSEAAGETPEPAGGIIVLDGGKQPVTTGKKPEKTSGAGTKPLKAREVSHCSTAGVRPEDLPKAKEFCEGIEDAYRQSAVWDAEEKFKSADRFRKQNPQIAAQYEPTAKKLARHCIDARLQTIAVQAATNCRDACKLTLEGLRLDQPDVAHAWLELDREEALQKLGSKCLDKDQSVKCGLLRKKLGRPEPTQQSAQPAPDASSGGTTPPRAPVPAKPAAPPEPPQPKPAESGKAGPVEGGGAGRTEITDPGAPEAKPTEGAGKKPETKKNGGASPEKSDPLDFGK